MARQLHVIPEPKPTREQVERYLQNPHLAPPDRLTTPLLWHEVMVARERARHTADALARNPEYSRLQAAFADATAKAGAAIDRRSKLADLRGLIADAKQRRAAALAADQGDEAHAAHMDQLDAQRQLDVMELEDLRTKGTDADPYKALADLDALKGKMKQAADDVKTPDVIMPRGWEHRARQKAPPVRVYR